MTVVYLDRVLLLNFMADYLLLLSAAQVAGAALRRLRFAAAAALGAVYAAAVFYWPVLAHPLLRLSGGALLALLAFFGEPRCFRVCAVFFLLSGMLAGLLLAAGLALDAPLSVVQRVVRADIRWWLLMPAFLFFYLLLAFRFRQSAGYGGGSIMEITVSLAGRHCRILALHDTGNTLRNPVDGRPVLVAETAALRQLWDREVAELLELPLSAEEKIVRLYRLGYTAFSLLPYHSIGREDGLLLAIRCDAMTLRRQVLRRPLVALYPAPMGNGSYQALWGGKEDGNELADAPSAVGATLQAG